MKAIRYYGPGDCRLEEIDTPEPGPEEVLVKVKAVGICATDVEIYDGVMFFFTSGRSRTPITPGHEWSGEVVSLGAEVTGFKPGDRVCGECSIGCRQCDFCKKGLYNLCPDRTETGILNRDGAFAEYIAFPFHYLHQCNDLSFEQACCIEPIGVAVYAVKRSRVSPEDIVVVFGVGPIGLFIVQVARAYGAGKVIAIDLIDDRCELALSQGADAAINPSREDAVQCLAELTHGRMADVVFESSGKAAALESIPALLAPGGRVGVVGLTGGERVNLDFDPLVVNNITLRGTVGGPNCWNEAIDLVGRGQVVPAITHRLPLSQFTKAITLTKTKQDGAVKVILTL